MEMLPWRIESSLMKKTSTTQTRCRSLSMKEVKKTLVTGRREAKAVWKN
jgi:hypothetical protein